jgi:hypothetical protein
MDGYVFVSSDWRLAFGQVTGTKNRITLEEIMVNSGF